MVTFYIDIHHNNNWFNFYGIIHSISMGSSESIDPWLGSRLPSLRLRPPHEAKILHLLDAFAGIYGWCGCSFPKKGAIIRLTHVNWRYWSLQPQSNTSNWGIWACCSSKSLPDSHWYVLLAFSDGPGGSNNLTSRLDVAIFAKPATRFPMVPDVRGKTHREEDGGQHPLI